MLALSAVTGRGTVAMWGYPLWLFLGLWIVLSARRALAGIPLTRASATWAIVFTCLGLAFVVNYAVLPRFDHRYRAVFFPGSDLGREISQRYRAVTGKPLVYVIATMWDGGNVEHYAPEHPRVLIDGKPARAPWIDLGDLRRRGAVVVWTAGDLHVIPPPFRTVAADAAVQPPFLLPYRRDDLQPLSRLGDPIAAAVLCGNSERAPLTALSPTMAPSSSSICRCMRLAIARSWVTATTVLPCLSTSSCSTSNTCSLACESSEPVGSSARMTGGSFASARATATRWRWPPENWSGRLCM